MAECVSGDDTPMKRPPRSERGALNSTPCRTAGARPVDAPAACTHGRKKKGTKHAGYAWRTISPPRRGQVLPAAAVARACKRAAAVVACMRVARIVGSARGSLSHVRVWREGGSVFFFSTRGFDRGGDAARSIAPCTTRLRRLLFHCWLRGRGALAADSAADCDRERRGSTWAGEQSWTDVSTEKRRGRVARHRRRLKKCAQRATRLNVPTWRNSRPFRCIVRCAVLLIPRHRCLAVSVHTWLTLLL